MKKALITGITGQDGFYLSQLLLDKGYEIYGLVRRNASVALGSLEKQPKQYRDAIHIIYGDVTDKHSIRLAIEKSNPDEIYHLAAQSFVHLSWSNPELTYNININGTLNVLNAIKETNNKIKMYFAGSSEQFGKVVESPQKETTYFYPRSPYGISKLSGYWTVKNYRESFGIFACSGILFNHESPMRGKEFVTRKITNAVAEIKHGKRDKVCLGNLEACRDWGHSRDYVRAMYLMLQQQQPDDFVIATGVTHSIKQFAEMAFSYCGLDYNKYIEIDLSFVRPAEVDILVGDPTKAKETLKWESSITFKDLVSEMVEEDIKACK